jgi:hypothetical protein
MRSRGFRPLRLPAGKYEITACAIALRIMGFGTKDLKEAKRLLDKLT